MQEIADIIEKYKSIELDRQLASKEGLKELSTMFYGDVAEIYDAVTRIKNVERNPTGFSLNDAAILGLLVRIWKLLKEVVAYYKSDNAQIISHFDRQIIESAVVVSYLLLKEEQTIEDYRKCSYKSRLKALEEAKNNEFYSTPAGIRLLKSIRAKMEAEGFDLNSFEEQKTHDWKLEGKSFYQIFDQIEPKEFYKLLYGIPSESIHGSWNESLDYDLFKNDDDTYSPNPFYQSVDIRFVTPILRLTNDPYLLWLVRIEAQSDYIKKVFDWITQTNGRLFVAFEKTYDLG
ncbi:MAG: hypothetical protein A2X59_10685 [Nitrospirae bacterium GWC2_42_7]|nr:MAG: hypothetical protein A2X59_10685 [Nitrospirae bacterium GWC2_42_7]